MLRFVVLSASLAICSAKGVVEASDANFAKARACHRKIASGNVIVSVQQVVDGNAAFVKFQAPWCAWAFKKSSKEPPR
jgi:hypothetical protein